jgi:hypothetical protein
MTCCEQHAGKGAEPACPAADAYPGPLAAAEEDAEEAAASGLLAPICDKKTWTDGLTLVR